MNTFAFVGERPSVRAVQIGATWANGRLAGKTLRQTLASLGIDPDRQCYLNLYKMPHRSDRDLRDEEEAITQIRGLQTDGYVIVGMGRTVCQRLEAYGIPHRQLTHPAARGSIRRTEHYRAHAKYVLIERAQLAALHS